MATDLYTMVKRYWKTNRLIDKKWNEIIEETHSNYDTNDECKLPAKYCKILGIDGEPAYGSRHRTADDPDDIQRKRNVQVDESIKVSHHFPIGQYSSVSFILDVHEYQNEHGEE